MDVVSPRLLVVEDDPTAAILMSEALAAIGVRPEHVSTCRDAYRALHRQDFACVVIDLGLPDGNGRDIQRSLQQRDDPPPVVFVTADDRAENAIEDCRAGAVACVIKRPEYLTRLREAVRKVVDLGGDVAAAERPHSAQHCAARALVGNSRQMRDVRTRIERCCRCDLVVLIRGETGTGKELVARAIHAGGPRAGEPFIAVNCAAITGSLFESELFGSVRGAFTGAVRDRGGLFAAAGRGTIFLDEIGELPLDAQAKLLRVLEDRSYRRVGDPHEARSRARVIVATNRDLYEAVEKGNFREDLFYRLDVLSVSVAPLRERLVDLPLLVAHFLRAEAGNFGERRVSTAALEQLRVHAWPGNVRELRHAITRSLVWSDEAEIDRFDLRSSGKRAETPRNRRGLGWNEMAESLRANGGRLLPAAEALQVSVRTLQRRMRDLGMNARDFR